MLSDFTIWTAKTDTDQQRASDNYVVEGGRLHGLQNGGSGLRRRNRLFGTWESLPFVLKCFPCNFRGWEAKAWNFHEQYIISNFYWPQSPAQFPNSFILPFQPNEFFLFALHDQHPLTILIYLLHSTHWHSLLSCSVFDPAHLYLLLNYPLHLGFQTQSFQPPREPSSIKHSNSTPLNQSLFQNKQNYTFTWHFQTMLFSIFLNKMYTSASSSILS